MVLIHEKITALLDQRRLKKRDLARALGVSPQTATDICKGRSAITLPHLRNLVSFFEIRAEFWLDDDRLTPSEVDQVARRGTADAISRSGLLNIEDPERLLQQLRTFVQQNRREFLSQFPDLTAPERRLLGLGEPEAKQAASSTRPSSTPPSSAPAGNASGSGAAGGGGAPQQRPAEAGGNAAGD